MDDQVINDESEVSAVKIIDQDPQEVEKTEKTSAGNEHDPYFYTNQDLFTSEIYKIELNNLPKFFGLGVSTFEIIYVWRLIIVYK